MGKQLQIYLDEIAVERLMKRAIRECRRPNDQARFIILESLGLVSDGPSSEKNAAPPIRQDAGAAVGINP